MSESMYPPIAYETTDHTERDSRRVYKILVEEVESSQHGSRFTLRPFSMDDIDDYPSPLNIEQSYYEPVASTDEHRTWLANLAGRLIMPEENYTELVGSMQRVYETPQVREHLAAGGTVKWLDSHFTYVGQVIQQIASWQALRNMGKPSPEQMQTTIVSRITSLFQLGALAVMCEAEGKKHRGGMIFEDVLLQYGGALQTLPRSASGNRLTEKLAGGLAMRKRVNGNTKLAYSHLINRGGQVIFEGPSGTENKRDEEGTHYLLGEVSDRTVELVTAYNKEDGAERILVIPFFMECAPFTGTVDIPLKPTPTPYAILKPRVIKSETEYHLMMHELATAGTIFKRSGTLPFKYDRINMLHSTPEPEIIEHYAA